MAQRKSLTIATLVLLAGVALSIAASRWVGAEMLRCAQLRFDVTAANAVVQVERRFAAYAEVLTGLRALFHAGNVSREGFHRFTEALELKGRFPGFQVLNYAPYVPAGSRQAFEKAVQRDPSRPALPRFSIDPPGNRDGYHPFTLLAPVEGNEHLFGRDIAVAAHTRTALDVARDTGKLTTSGKLIQVRGKQQQVGLALRLPVYRTGMPTDTLSQRRSAYLGSVGAGFLMTPMFADLPGVPHGVRVRLYEGGPEPIVERAEAASMPEADRLMFDSDTAGRAPAPAAAAASQEPPAPDRFRRVQSFKLGDRVWDVDVSAPVAQGERPVETWASLAVLLSGIAISAALSGLLFGLLVSRHRASARLGT